MSNTTLTADVIAKEALVILENNLVMANNVHRAHEDEFKSEVNGYKKGAKISIRRPAQFAVRRGATMNVQPVTEGKTTLTVDTQIGVDFEFSSSDLTLQIGELSERVMKPALVQLANEIDVDVFSLYKNVNNWVGTPGQLINSFADFAKGPERMDLLAMPQDGRKAMLSPSDAWGMLGTQTALYMQDAAKDAYRKAKLGTIGNVETFSAQNVPTHTRGSAATAAVNGAWTASTISYSDVKDTDIQTRDFDTFVGGTDTIKAGDVFTIAGVYEVNPISKSRIGTQLKQFVVNEDKTASGNAIAGVSFSPALIWDGPFQNAFVDDTDLDGAVITFLGTASTGYAQNLFFHKNAFALAMVPMEMPQAVTGGSRQSYKGLSVRVLPVYDGINDKSAWRLDLLYGTKTLDRRLAIRGSGTSG